MDQSTMLSIIIPNYNSGSLLEETLDSIFSGQNSLAFEVLVMDNCSSDHPEKILAKFPHERLHFHSEPDLGVYDAMNKGIIAAKGEWIYFLGAGDLPYMNTIALIPFAELGNTSLVYGNVSLHGKNYIFDGRFDLGKLLNRNISHQAIFCRKSILEKFDCFDLRYRIMADYYLNLQIFFRFPEQVAYFDSVYSEYRGGGLSDRVKDRVFTKRKQLTYLELLIKNPTSSNLGTMWEYFLSKLKILVLKA
jgi:glycosyltransferase involved in cell wall biosynthesis